ncbi:integral membrane protein [Plectosphaerella plurivora]|uniref:Integral membrane protein n=1 Tax=Plectosphaerella plurivora TaxID=936078 RepID=A0A9P9A9Z6_9PEZI|nr:integral membrane protein [Plectosphaerella plurivora]
MSSSDGRVGQLPPPPGIVPNFDNPRDVGHNANITGLIICCVLATTLIAIRAYVRFFVNRRILVSDVTCFFGWLFSMTYAGTAFAMVHHGLGYHAYEVTREEYAQVLKWLYAGSVVYIPAAYLVKVTLLLLIARVFAVEERIAKGIHIFIFVLLCTYIPVQTLKTWICYPIRAYWDPLGVANFGCINQRVLFITDLTIAVITDLVIVILPIPVTWNMRLPIRKKIKIIFMLGAGGLATGVTFLRLIKCIIFLKADDVTADFVIIDLTTFIELTIGIVCACLPAAHFLLDHQRELHKRKRAGNRPRSGRFLPHVGGSSWLSTLTRKTLRSGQLTGGGMTEQNPDAANITAEVDPESTQSNLDGQPATPVMEMYRSAVRTPPLVAGALDPDMPAGTRCHRDNGDEVCCEDIRLAAQRRFDLELARFTGRSIEDEEEDDIRVISLHAPAGTRASSRLNETEGRREGWLAPKEECGDMTDLEAAMAISESVHQRFRYWTTIWDGSQRELPDPKTPPNSSGNSNGHGKGNGHR